MYRLDWIETLKLRKGEVRPGGTIRDVNPTVWKLGFTSLFTDISTEMVNSLLPVYVVLHLHMSPLQFGAIDGIYNGVAIALLSIAAGFIADRTRRPKEVAFVGYGISAVSKLLLLLGSAWSGIAAIIALDRAGKGARTAPRDAMISLSTPSKSLALAFAVHRGLDAGGALLGPIIAFLILWRMPNAFDAIWVTSFAFAVLGLSVLWLFVQNPTNVGAATRLDFSWRKIPRDRFWKLATAGGLLALMTLSDGFLYLLLQRRTGLAIGFFPLFYVVTACSYMLLSIPVGSIADRFGRVPVLLVGYLTAGLIYLFLLTTNMTGIGAALLCLFFYGLYYAGTEGVLAAMASSVIPVEYRTRGLAILATTVSAGKFCSSLLFGWLWQTCGMQTALTIVSLGLAGSLGIAIYLLRESHHA
jgi:MFS family permease